MVATCIRILQNRLLLQEVNGSGLFAWGIRMGTNWVSGVEQLLAEGEVFGHSSGEKQKGNKW